MDGLNNEMKQINEFLTYNKEFNSFSNRKNNNSNLSNEISADEDFINNEVFSQSQFEQYVYNENQYNYSTYQYNMELINTNKPNVIHQTDKGFYRTQSNCRTQSSESIIHFFSWQNPSVCECGVMCNI